MARIPPAAPVHGALAGLAAGAVVALWFLILDSAGGRPFHTPIALANAVLGTEVEAAGARLLITYSVLHFGVFAVVGAATSAALRLLGLAPGVLPGVVVGLGVLELVHYGALLMTGARIIAVVPPGHVLAANLLAGVAMMGALHYLARSETPFGIAALRRHEVVARGLVTGLIGAAAVAVWFFVLDVWQATPFFTPAALGSGLFLGAAGPDQVQVGLGVVGAYTVAHVAAFAAVGIGLVVVAERLERTPGLWLMALLAFLILEGLFVAIFGSFAAWVTGELGWWAVGVGNLVAVVGMGYWVWHTHPVLRRELTERPLETAL